MTNYAEVEKLHFFRFLCKKKVNICPGQKLTIICLFHIFPNYLTHLKMLGFFVWLVNTYFFELVTKNNKKIHSPKNLILIFFLQNRHISYNKNKTLILKVEVCLRNLWLFSRSGSKLISIEQNFHWKELEERNQKSTAESHQPAHLCHLSGIKWNFKF